MATITCKDCGAERTRCPKNTKYCKPCRLLRDIAYWEHERRTCLECRATFAPLGRTDYHCSACRPGIHGREVSCAFGHTGGLVLTGIPVCAACLRAPAKRASLMAALKRGQAQRRQERNDATT